jgi:hypothetical protein
MDRPGKADKGWAGLKRVCAMSSRLLSEANFLRMSPRLLTDLDPQAEAKIQTHQGEDSK